MLVVLPLTGCYSLAVQTTQLHIRTESKDVHLVVDCHCDVGRLHSDDVFGSTYAAFISVLLYPVDVVGSTAVAVVAVFDRRQGVRWGVAGAAAGICLPWVTLFHGGLTCPLWRGYVADVDALTFEHLVYLQENDREGLAERVLASVPYVSRVGAVRLVNAEQPIRAGVDGWRQVDLPADPGPHDLHAERSPPVPPTR